MIVYHYTSKEFYDEIMRAMTLKPSSPWTTMDAAYGIGWYFTDLGPDICDMAIAYRCWQDTTALYRTEYYLKFDIDAKILKKCREHVYILEKWDKDLVKYLEGQKNKSCSLKPCETCEKGEKYRQ